MWMFSKKMKFLCGYFSHALYISCRCKLSSHSTLHMHHIVCLVTVMIIKMMSMMSMVLVVLVMLRGMDWIMDHLFHTNRHLFYHREFHFLVNWVRLLDARKSFQFNSTLER